MGKSRVKDGRRRKKGMGKIGMAGWGEGKREKAGDKTGDVAKKRGCSNGRGR